jgi:hypothetical protein
LAAERRQTHGRTARTINADQRQQRLPEPEDEPAEADCAYNHDCHDDHRVKHRHPGIRLRTIRRQQQGRQISVVRPKVVTTQIFDEP